MANNEMQVSRIIPRVLAAVFIGWVITALPVAAQEHKHDHAHHGEQDTAAKKPVRRPRVFLDKSPRIVWYQLNRLDNERLLLVERETSDLKYAPVYTAILTRGGMSPQYREEALAGLVTLNKSDAATELLAALETVDAEGRQQRRTARQLAHMLLHQPEAVLQGHSKLLLKATDSENAFLRSLGYAGLLVARRPAVAWAKAQKDQSSTLAWLAAAALAPRRELLIDLRDAMVGLIRQSDSLEVRRAAITAIAFTPNQRGDTFQLIAPLFSEPKLREAVVKTLLTIPAEQRDLSVSQTLLDAIMQHAESTPAANRTTDAFLDAVQLAEQLLVKTPVAAARSYRERLREVAVRVVRIHTVDEEMRYDTAYFAVEAGRPVQVVLINEDLMAHNLVITAPGALQEVAQLGLQTGTTNGLDGKQFVPKSDKVLHATHLVAPEKQERLTFNAPAEPGEYPYVCTFPRHWMRMYGVMVVVPDLDAWLKNPTAPKDPVGNNRAFVQAWKVEDLANELDTGFRGRSSEIGARLFKDATCSQCHKMRGQGGAVGPELTEVFKRWKGDRLAVLREVLLPSHRIDPKYAVHLVVTEDGRTISGIMTAEDKKTISILANPEAKEPLVIRRDEIDEIVKTSVSMMPKALLDRFTKDEIFEILAFLETVGVEAGGVEAGGANTQSPLGQ